MATVQLAPVHTRLLKTWTTLAASAVAASHTGDTTETILATIPLAAGAMGANGIISCTTVWSITNSTNAKTLRGRLGGLSGTAFQTIAVSTSGQISYRDMRVLQNRNAQNSQIILLSTSESLGAGTAAPTTMAVDTSVALDLVFTAQLANSGETITLEAYSVELYYTA